MPQITFWTVQNAKEKLNVVSGLVQRHFRGAERVLLTAPNDAAARYLDQLLWSCPPESFLPHAVSQTPLPAAVVITTLLTNLNQAQVLINLCPSASAIAGEFLHIHELFDATDAEKQRLSIERQKTYEAAGFSVTTKRLDF